MDSPLAHGKSRILSKDEGDILIPSPLMGEGRVRVSIPIPSPLMGEGRVRVIPLDADNPAIPAL